MDTLPVAMQLASSASTWALFEWVWISRVSSCRRLHFFECIDAWNRIKQHNKLSYMEKSKKKEREKSRLFNRITKYCLWHCCSRRQRKVVNISQLRNLFFHVAPAPLAIHFRTLPRDVSKNGKNSTGQISFLTDGIRNSQSVYLRHETVLLMNWKIIKLQMQH